MQLVATGAQDAVLTANPTVTFFKISYKKHTPFAEESIEQTFNGPADFGKRVTCTISRNADLIRQIYLQVTLPAQTLKSSEKFRWLHYPGHRLIKKIEVEIGGQTIDKHYGEWMHIWWQLTCPPGSRKNYEDMIGHSADLVLMKDASGIALDATCAPKEMTNTCVSRAGTPAKTLYIPLQFWFNSNPGLALPLIALQYHEVKINIEFAQFYEMAYWEGASYAPNRNLVAASLYVDYVYLDTDERRTMSQKTHEYLIEQLQFTGGETITSSSYKSRLNFNHPCKALYWVVQRDDYVTCGSEPSSTQWIKAAGGAQPFNFSDDWRTEQLALNELGRGALATRVKGSAVVDGAAYQVPGGLAAGRDIHDSTTDSDAANDDADEFLSGTTNYLIAKVLLESGVVCEGKNPVEVAKIQLNGHDRFAEREGRFFDKLQIWKHHSAAGQTGINMYSFGLKPEEHQPSGTCNFSRIDTATLHLTMSVNTVRDQRSATLRVYAVNYNTIKIISGMLGISFAS